MTTGPAPVRALRVILGDQLTRSLASLRDVDLACDVVLHRMSDYCGGCRCSPDERTGPNACPFNPLCSDFRDRNAERLAKNPRLAMPYAALAKMTLERRAEIARDAEAVLARLAPR